MAITNQFMRWHIVSKADYAAGSASVVATDLYFISDTHEIYRGGELFTPAVSFYTTTSGLPAKPALDRIYFNTDTLEGKVYNGTSWVDIIKPLGSVTSANTTNPVSGKSVVDYVTQALASYQSSNIVSSVSWDSATSKLTLTKLDNTTSNVILTGVPVDIELTGNNEIILKDVNGDQVGTKIALDVERFVKSGEYDTVTQTIILYFDDDKTDKVVIPASDLVDVYTVESSSTVALSMESNKITGSVKISGESGNVVQAKADGIYVTIPEVDFSGVISKLDDPVAGNVPMIASDGSIEDSGISSDELTDVPGQISTAATNTLNSAKTYADDTFIPKANIVTSANLAADISAASDSKVVSEKLLMEALTWMTTM